jgi:hypothetical protein
MIDDFDDFCLWVYVIVDDLYQQIAPLFNRPGPPPLCSDSELLTMALVGECRGWAIETEMLSYWREHHQLFPHLPSQSRFNRRRRHLMDAFALIRLVVLDLLDLAQDRQCVIDSLPVPVVQFHWAPCASSEWAAHGASFGKVASKHLTIFGYKLHLLITCTGVILDFALAPANAADLTIGHELLLTHHALDVVGDKGYISQPMAEELAAGNAIRLLTIPRRNQKHQLPAPFRKLLNVVRQIIESVNSQLTAQFHIEINHAHTFWGLCTRLLTKLAAHTLCIHINRLLGNASFLHVKSLAFPI